jgi:hypothetical protein
MKKLSLLAVVPLALVLAGTAFAANQPKVQDPKDVKVEVVVTVETAVAVEASSPVEADLCDEELFTPATPETPTLLATNLATAASCKPCKNRTWCKCTYNGLPRVSCDPCCYGNLGVPMTCFD